jgi:hypothetical protein
MRRTIWLLLAGSGLAAYAQPQEIAAAASSPYDLSKYVQEHHNFNWGPLWQALGIKDESVFLPPCEESFRGVPPCSSELITITDPLQLIVLLEHMDSSFQAFLRYESAGSGRWRFSCAYAPNVKYFRPEHRTLRFGAKPFLVITEQGISGSGVSSKIECWFDLTGRDFKPVLAFTSEGAYSAFPDGISRQIWARVTSMAMQPVERIEVAMDVDFKAVEGINHSIPLGRRGDKVVYTRSGSGGFKLVPRLSAATADEIAKFYEVHDDEASDEEFPKFHYKGLVALAKSQDEEARSWLLAFLAPLPDSKEARELKSLMAAHR